MMAIRRLMAKASRSVLSSRRVRCFSTQKEKKIGKLLLVGHFCTRVNDN
jgi:hypothetical protein